MVLWRGRRKGVNEGSESGCHEGRCHVTLRRTLNKYIHTRTHTSATATRNIDYYSICEFIIPQCSMILR